MKHNETISLTLSWVPRTRVPPPEVSATPDWSTNPPVGLGYTTREIRYIELEDEKHLHLKTTYDVDLPTRMLYVLLVPLQHRSQEVKR